MSKKANCTLECPRCKKVWGKLSYEFESYVKASDVKVIAGKHKKFRAGDSLACTCCGHEYTNYDVYLAIHAGMVV
jgi:uncharacterized protein (DUF983 family)